MFIITAYFRQVVSIGTFYYADKQCRTARWNVLSGWFLTSLQPAVDFFPGLRERGAPAGPAPLLCEDQPRVATPFRSTLSREVKPQRCVALRKLRTNTGDFPCPWPWLPSRVLLFSQILFLYFSFSSPPERLLFPRPGVGAWRGVARRCGYIWLLKNSQAHAPTASYMMLPDIYRVHT